MEKYDLVSIVIPCYNQAQFLEESVQSAVIQSYQNIEIIIVNDGSTDNTQEISEGLQKKHPEKIHIINQENMGLSEARNSGIREASGKYIVSMDSDDKLYETMVEKCITTIQHHNDADIVYTGYQGFGISDRINMWKPFEQTDPLYATPCSSLAFIKKKVWEITGGYKYNMMEGYEDWEFWINAYKHNMKFIHIPEKLFFYRIKDESMVTNAMKKDAYLKAKIVMNHPELYTTHQVKKSIEEIQKSEDLADVYFYIPKNKPKMDTKVIQAINDYLSVNYISDISHFTIANQNIELYALDNVNDKKTIKNILKKTDTKKVLFYTHMRYEVKSLDNCHFAWKDGDMIESQGTFFPYVFKETREDAKSQLLAHRRLEKYHEYIFDKLNNLQRKYNNDQNNANKKFNDLLKKYDAELDIANKKFNDLDQKHYDLNQKHYDLNQKHYDLNQIYNDLMQSLSDITKVKTFKSPLKKISAYKKILALYHKYR
ncbi:MAG: glycosyltransferase family A protein [Campylobacterota bacterium]|nr:glycosyltransferase family A protein [Campylobacterota bacterium]